MTSNMNLLGLASVGVMALLLSPRAQAGVWNQQTTFTFNQPVEIPGQVLDPGTYVFKQLNSMWRGDIIEVWNKNENRSYGTFLAVPDYRLKPTGKVTITFEERAEGAPPAVKAWFFPGDDFGHEFVYPKAKTEALAQLNRQTVTPAPQPAVAETTPAPAPQAEVPPAATPQAAPMTAENQSAERAETPQEVTPAPAPAPQSLPQQLPQTASDLPLIALCGLLSLASAALLRRVRAH